MIFPRNVLVNEWGHVFLIHIFLVFLNSGNNLLPSFPDVAQITIFCSYMVNCINYNNYISVISFNHNYWMIILQIFFLAAIVWDAGDWLMSAHLVILETGNLPGVLICSIYIVVVVVSRLVRRSLTSSIFKSQINTCISLNTKYWRINKKTSHQLHLKNIPRYYCGKSYLCAWSRLN